MVGESIGGFEAGVSPESLALDYRNSSSVIETENLELSIYPNPASELIHITTNMDFYKLIVSDLSGRIIIKKSIYAKQEALDISFLEKGIYHMTLLGRSSNSSLSFIVQ